MYRIRRERACRRIIFTSRASYYGRAFPRQLRQKRTTTSLCGESKALLPQQLARRRLSISHFAVAAYTFGPTARNGNRCDTRTESIANAILGRRFVENAFVRSRCRHFIDT